MPSSDPLVSIGLPVRNAESRVAGVVRSILAQDHTTVELIISDNASTDGTEEVCRELAAADPRVVYHRQPENVGLLNNFMTAMRLANGPYFRWVGDDDALAPTCVSRGLEAFAADERLVLVTTQVGYLGPDGESETAVYKGHGLGSDDPVDRLVEWLRLLTESHLLLDPLYGLMKREPVAAIPRRNMLREDEVFAAKLALAGPWAHIPEVLAYRHWKRERLGRVAQRLGVPSWQARMATALECREMARYIRDSDLAPAQRRRAYTAISGLLARRSRRLATRRGRKLLSLAGGWRRATSSAP